eukprot:1194574-Prorocentrum_minimum.AAC.10
MSKGSAMVGNSTFTNSSRGTSSRKCPKLATAGSNDCPSTSTPRRCHFSCHPPREIKAQLQFCSLIWRAFEAKNKVFPEFHPHFAVFKVRRNACIIRLTEATIPQSFVFPHPHTHNRNHRFAHTTHEPLEVRVVAPTSLYFP